MSKENKGREFYVDLIDLQRCDKTLDLGEGSGCRIVYYPHRDDLYRLVKVIQYSEFEKCQAEKQALEQRLAAKEQDLRDYKHEWESACERVRDRDCEITDLKQRLADAESDLKKLVTAFKQTCNLTGTKQYEFLSTLKTSLADGSKDD